MIPTRTTYQVLLIEEDPEQTDLYSSVIREVANCRLDVMSRIESSLEWISRSNYHLVVIDLPASQQSEGLNILEQLKRLSPLTSVILLSSQATVEQAVAAIRMGAEDYFQKPFNLEAFQLAIKRGLDRKTIFAENSSASTFLNLLNSCQLISAQLDQKKIFGVVQSYLSRELRCQHSAIYVLRDGNPVRLPEIPREGQSDAAMEEVLDIALHATNPLRAMLDSGDPQDCFRFVDRGQLTPGFFIFRFRCADPHDYFCVALSPARPDPMLAFESRLRMLKAQIEVTGKSVEQYRGVQNLAYLDDATGLYNTRYLNTILDREIQHAQTSGKSFAVLFIDADRFKGVNDAHGHLTGTRLLNELGAHLKRLVREKDTVFRYGGDEFVAVLSPCDLSTARLAAERIRASVEKKGFLKEDGVNLHFTVSIGVALFPDHAKSKQSIINAADHAMYSAKKTTRNSVSIAEMAPVKSEAPQVGDKGAAGVS